MYEKPPDKLTLIITKLSPLRFIKSEIFVFKETLEYDV